MDFIASLAPPLNVDGAAKGELRDRVRAAKAAGQRRPVALTSAPRGGLRTAPRRAASRAEPRSEWPNLDHGTAAADGQAVAAARASAKDAAEAGLGDQLGGRRFDDPKSRGSGRGNA